jgi:hypothetical protein
MPRDFVSSPVDTAPLPPYSTPARHYLYDALDRLDPGLFTLNAGVLFYCLAATAAVLLILRLSVKLLGWDRAPSKKKWR